MEPPLADDRPPVEKKRRLLWFAYLVCWTTALVTPIRDDSSWVVPSLADLDLKYLLAKTLHVGGYAVFAALSGWLRSPLRFRWWVMFILMSHPTLTELIQLYVPGRSGSLYDAALDLIGILLGLVLTRKWWIELT
jgi:VanZ family protein